MAANAQQPAGALLHRHRRWPPAARRAGGGLRRNRRGHPACIARCHVNLTEAWNRLRDRLRRERLTSELDEELRFHQTMLERDQTHGGSSPEDMQRRARLALGNTTYHKES